MYFEVPKAVISTIGYAIFFFGSQALWKDFDSGVCMAGPYQVPFFNWIALLVLTVVPAILIALSVCCCLICSPCLYRLWSENRQRQQQEEEERTGVLDAIVKVSYTPAQFTKTTECAICFLEFKEDDEVTPLPCDTSHYFHSECIE